MLLQSGFTKHLNILCSPYGWLLMGCTAFVLYHVFSKPFGTLNLSSFCLLRTPDLIQSDLIHSSLLLLLPWLENCIIHRHAAHVTALSHCHKWLLCPPAAAHMVLPLALCQHWCLWDCTVSQGKEPPGNKDFWVFRWIFRLSPWAVCDQINVSPVGGGKQLTGDLGRWQLPPSLTQAESYTCPTHHWATEWNQQPPPPSPLLRTRNQVAGPPAVRVEENLQPVMLLRWDALTGPELAYTLPQGWGRLWQRVFTFSGRKSYLPVTINRILQFWRGSIYFPCPLQLLGVWTSTHNVSTTLTFIWLALW